MKKSNALMLSYIIFLAVALFVDVFFNWGGLGKVAMAAALAGLLFAIADLIAWRVTCEQDFCSIVQKALSEVILSVDKLKLRSESAIEENHEIIELISSREDRSGELSKILETSQADIRLQEENIQASEKNKSKAEDLNKKMQEMKNRKIRKFKKAETAIIVLGFVSFFVISAFDYLYALLLNVESEITVIAFGVIMVTYFLKDVFENRHKKELEKALGSLKESEGLLERAMQSVTERKRKKEIKTLIDTLETEKALAFALEKLKSRKPE